MAKRLPAGFLADTAVELDPRRVAGIIAATPEELVVAVARELGARGEHVAMGRFLAFVPDHAIAGAIGVLDDATLLHTAFVLEHKDRLDDAIALLPEGRMAGVLRAATELDLWAEALDLLDQLSGARREAIAGLVAAEDPAMLTAVIRTAAAEGLWVDLVPLLEVLPNEVRLRVAGIAAGLEPELLRAVLRDAAEHADALPPLLDLVRQMTPAERAIVVEAIDAADRGLAEELAARFSDPALAAPLLARLTDDLSDAISRAAERFGLEDTLAAARRRPG